jgi:solute carrier family 31 (copper transporter), member 1
MTMSMSSGMQMSMSTTGHATHTMTGMSMGTASSSASMGGMGSSSSSMMMGMSDMAMVFFTSVTTPLFSYAWTPTGEGQYAGTCIFLIIFAAIFRGILAVRVRFYDIMAAVRQRQQHIPYHKVEKGTSRWRAGEAMMIGALDVVLAGLSYLL